MRAGGTDRVAEAPDRVAEAPDRVAGAPDRVAGAPDLAGGAPDRAGGPPARTAPLAAAVLAVAVGVAIGIAASACASVGLGGDDAGDRFHRLWEDGRYPAAVAVFERDSTLRSDPRTLWRVALARLRPAGEEEGAGPEDPAGAARALERLLELEPDGRRAAEARAMLRLLDTLEEVRTQLERLKEIDLGEEPGRP